MMNSCVDKDINIFENDEEEGLNLTLSLYLPQMESLQTRGILDNPVENPDPDDNPNAFKEFINNIKLYMFIFEDAGSPESNYLRTLVHGEDITSVSTDFETAEHPGQVLRTFKAKVDGTSENAIIHIVATNDPDFEDQLKNTTDRSELGLFYGATGLYTSGEYPAFWKRIELNSPINIDVVETQDFKDKLSHIQMVRNFCRVTVSLNSDKV